MLSEQQVNAAIEQYADSVLRICMVYLKNHADAEDVFQTVFFRYAARAKEFESPEHERAWIVRVTVNACKDVLKSLFRRRTVPLEEGGLFAQPPRPPGPVTEAVLSLPQRYREVIYLHYYEGYTIPEIAELVHRNPNTLYTDLRRGREQLKNILKEDPYGT